MTEEYRPFKGEEIKKLVGEVVAREDNPEMTLMITGANTECDEVFMADVWTCIHIVFEDFRFLDGTLIGKKVLPIERSHDNLTREEFLMTASENCENIYMKYGNYNNEERTTLFKDKEELTKSHVWKKHFNWLLIKDQFSKDGYSFEEFSNKAEHNCANVLYLHSNGEWTFSRIPTLKHLLNTIKEDNSLHKYKFATFMNIKNTFSGTLDVQVSDDKRYWKKRTLVGVNPLDREPYKTLTSQDYEEWAFCRVEEFSRNNPPPPGVKFIIEGVTGVHRVSDIQGSYIRTEAGSKFSFSDNGKITWFDM